MTNAGICAIPRTPARLFRGAAVPGWSYWIAARWEVAPPARGRRASMDFVRGRGSWTVILQHTNLIAAHTTNNIHVHFDRNWHLRFAQFVYGRALTTPEGSASTAALVAPAARLISDRGSAVTLTFRGGNTWFERLTILRDQFHQLGTGAVFRDSRLVRQARGVVMTAFRKVPFVAWRAPDTGASRSTAEVFAARVGRPLQAGLGPAAVVRTLFLHPASSVLTWPAARFTTRHDYAMDESGTANGPSSSYLYRSHTLVVPGRTNSAIGAATFGSGGPITKSPRRFISPALSMNGRPVAPQVLTVPEAAHSQKLTLHHVASSPERLDRPAAPVSLTFVKRESNHTEAITQTLAQIQQSLSGSKIREAAAPAVDIPYLTRQVYDQFERELRIERERKGI